MKESLIDKYVWVKHTDYSYVYSSHLQYDRCSDKLPVIQENSETTWIILFISGPCAPGLHQVIILKQREKHPFFQNHNLLVLFL